MGVSFTANGSGCKCHTHWLPLLLPVRELGCSYAGRMFRSSGQTGRIRLDCLDMAKGNKGDKGPNTNKDTKAFLAWLDGVPDPQERYRRATEELEKHQQAVEQLSSVRALAAADAYEAGETVRALADRLGVSPSRVHQLIQEAKAQTAKAAGRERRQSGRQKGST